MEYQRLILIPIFIFVDPLACNFSSVKFILSIPLYKSFKIQDFQFYKSSLIYSVHQWKALKEVVPVERGSKYYLRIKKQAT